MSLRQDALTAGRWTASSAFVRAVLQILQIVILARILLPEDFGLMAIAGAMLAVSGFFSDLGLSKAIVHFEHIPKRALSSLFWLNLGAGSMLTVIFAVIAPAVASGYSQPELSAVLAAVSPVFLLSALGEQFRALGQKELQFRILASNEIIASVVGFFVAIATAWGGGGVYALVAAVLATTFASSLLAWLRLSHERLPRLSFQIRETRPYVRYGMYLIGENLASTLHRQADVFIGGLVASISALGFYSIPRDLSLRLAMLVNPIITKVGFPVMARVQGDAIALKDVYLQTLRMTASVNFPIYVAMAVFSTEMVVFLYGDRWLPAAEFLRILSAWGLIRSIGNPVGSLLYAVGRARLAFWWNIALLVVYPPVLWFSANQWGLVGLAWSMLAAQGLIMLPSWWFLVRPSCGVGLVEFLSVLAVPFLLAIISGAAAYIVGLRFDSVVLTLLLGISVGGITYLVLSVIFNRAWTRVMFEFALPMLRMKM